MNLQAALFLTCILSAGVIVQTMADQVTAEQEITERRINEGVYTRHQAKSGKRLFKKYCLSCHEDGYFESVLLAWRGEHLSSFYELIKADMPENDPGSLSTNQYIEILSYILKQSNYPEGTGELDPSSQSFNKLIIEN